MIKTLKHKGLRSFFETGNKSGIQTHHVPLLTRQLVRLDVAKNENDLNIPSWKLHILTGELSGFYSIKVNGNWRITFTFEGEDAILVDYLDYH